MLGKLWEIQQAYTARSVYRELQLFWRVIQGYIQLLGHFLEGIIRDG